MLEPSDMIIYVNNLAKSSVFYQDLLGLHPQEHSPSFALFKLRNGLGLGLKEKHTVHPAAEGLNGYELAFTMPNPTEVDTLFLKWQAKGIHFAQTPTEVSFGYTFLALDPDNNRLRVLSR
ncbi:VOC family protein [Legionella sp. km772]|uniref:VOC family protein n=1 Tax=Legionella sp. km772 TaxID=2498111 RepID=UPI000F8F6686|nr:VOC family protein [Legionella sp. km772]RUR11312.1 hypothetical protein ELY15_07265 [Legionella sp. km772]